MEQEPITLAIAEDHAFMRQVICDGLQELGFAINITACHGQDLLKQLTATSILPDVCIIDLNMPVMDGFTAIQEIKSYLPDMILIAMSMDNAETQKQKALDAGASAFFVKDDSLEMLAELAKSSIRNSKAFTSEIT